VNIEEMELALAKLTLQYFNQQRGLDRLAHDIDVLQAAIDGYNKGEESGLVKDTTLQRT
jgi:hypothetical protein